MTKLTKPAKLPKLPWIDEAQKVFGLHEVRDKAKLTAWLKSDKRLLGDPSLLPWCGDFVETAILNSLAEEKFLGNLAKNPYWARNWLEFGVATKPVYGAVAVFGRGKGGHVGFLVGEDATDFYVLGGNQSNMVCVTRIAKNRLLGTRWAASFANKNTPLPQMTPGDIVRTTNEE